MKPGGKSSLMKSTAFALGFRACLHGGRGPQVDEVKTQPSFTCNLTTPPSQVALSQDYWMVVTHVNKKMLENNVFWRLMLFNTHLLLLLQPSVLWLSIVTFNNDAKPPPKWVLREFDVSRILPRLGGLPHLETFTWRNLTPAESVTRSGRSGYPPWQAITPPIM